MTHQDGGEYRRNRRHLLLTTEPRPEIAPDYDYDDDVDNLVPQEPVADPPSQSPPRHRSARNVRLPMRFRQDYVME